MKAASESGTGRRECTGCYCNNKEMVVHCTGSKKCNKLKAKQSQTNLVRLCKELLRGMIINVTYRHVRGHMDDLLQRDQMSLQEDLNIDTDKLADEALKKAVRDETSIKTM